QLLQYAPDSCAVNYENTNEAFKHAFLIDPNKLGTYSEASLADADKMLKGNNSIFITKDSTIGNDANSSKILAQTTTYPRLVYAGADDSALLGSDIGGALSAAEGIYIVGVKDSRTSTDKADYYDFYIRTCWYGIDSERPSTISTVIRLNDLDATKYDIGEQVFTYKINDDVVGRVKSNYASGSPLLAGKEITLTAEITRPGFKFLGWYDKTGKWLNDNPEYKCIIGKPDCETNVTAKFGIEINVLNVYPDTPGSKVFDAWMAAWGLNEKDPDGTSKKIKVDSVPISQFNANPNAYLKDGNNWKYDLLVFGFWDCNNNRDLSQASRNATEAYLKANKAVIFGHDTITDYCIANPQFNSLASYAGLKHVTPAHTPWAAGDKLRIVEDSRMTSYPHMIYGRILDVPYSHEVQFTYRDSANRPTGKVLIRYNNDLSSDTQSNFYLGTYKNTATIMTGHSSGKASVDEQKIFANLVFYLYACSKDASQCI
ncbi:DUF5057 domain-containing protein, partial [Candidatus Saccharibacteria bacterium]|nr:DUF5057 domain-containing protein [Candidatus Saccharibacteria bacterium]